MRMRIALESGVFVSKEERAFFRIKNFGIGGAFFYFWGGFGEAFDTCVRLIRRAVELRLPTYYKERFAVLTN